MSDLRSNKGAEKPKGREHGSVMNSMVKNIVAQRLAGDYANEEGIARLVSELEDPSTAPERRNAVTVLRLPGWPNARSRCRKETQEPEGETPRETFQKLKQLCNRESC